MVGRRLGEDHPTQDESINLMAQLHNADLLHGEVSPDMAELARRSAKQKTRSLLLRLRNPLALRFPLLDPDRFLTATAPLVRPLFSVLGFIVWLGLVVSGIVLAALHWPELTANITDRVLAVENVVLILLSYPAIKALHELGHGYATKIWGGEVHEMGVMLLVLLPIPYVDASACSAFREKWRRALVGGAGIMVELLLAALATIVWVAVEPGLVRAIAFNVMLIGGVSTMLFNGNPLLRFDGYYVLCDILEIPNLGSRANRYIFYLVQRYGFGVEDLTSPADLPAERGWFLVYGLAAFAYRVFIMIAIALFVAGQLFFIGVLLAIWAVVSMFLAPIVKGMNYLVTHARLRRRRRRAFAVVGVAAAVVLFALLLVPVPYATMAQGVVWLPEDTSVRAETGGTVIRVLAQPNRRVMPGQALFALEDPIVQARVELMRAQLREYTLRLDAVKLVDLVQADMLREQVRHTEAALALDRQRLENLTVRSRNEGRFIVPLAADLPGRFVHKGDLLGYVVGSADPVVRVIVPQAQIDLVRGRTAKVEMRFVERLDQVVPGVVLRESPAAIKGLPSRALGTAGGGEVALDPSDPESARALESLFQLDLGLSAALPSDRIGGRFFVRFDHGREAVAWRLLRALRQLFLGRFNV